MLPSRNSTINNYGDWLLQVINNLPNKSIEWKVIVPFIGKQSVLDNIDLPINDSGTEILINGRSHQIRFYKNAKYVDLLIKGTDVSYLEFVDGHNVIQRHAFEYYMFKHNLKTVTELYQKISYPIQKLNRMMSHEFYCDVHCSGLMAHLTTRSPYFWKKLQR